MKHKLSKNFSSSEFTKKSWTKLPVSKQYLLKSLCSSVLQPARDVLGPLKITSGLRTQADYNRLKKQGYNPSSTSDHNFGNAAKLTPSNRRYKSFGEVYNYSVGAADIIPANVPVWEAFEILVEMSEKGTINPGQIIYEKKKNGVEWIHISNHPELVYSRAFINQTKLNKTRYLTTRDGGKTYIKYGTYQYNK